MGRTQALVLLDHNTHNKQIGKYVQIILEMVSINTQRLAFEIFDSNSIPRLSSV
jgi:hypothetical protein